MCDEPLFWPFDHDKARYFWPHDVQILKAFLILCRGMKTGLTMFLSLYKTSKIPSWRACTKKIIASYRMRNADSLEISSLRKNVCILVCKCVSQKGPMFASCHACVCIKVKILVAFWASSTCSKCCVRIIPSARSDNNVTLDFLWTGCVCASDVRHFQFTRRLSFSWHPNHDSHWTIEVFQLYGRLQMLWATACEAAGCRHVCTVTANAGFAYHAQSNTLVKFDPH